MSPPLHSERDTERDFGARLRSVAAEPQDTNQNEEGTGRLWDSRNPHLRQAAGAYAVQRIVRPSAETARTLLRMQPVKLAPSDVRTPCPNGVAGDSATVARDPLLALLAAI